MDWLHLQAVGKGASWSPEQALYLIFSHLWLHVYPSTSVFADLLPLSFECVGTQIILSSCLNVALALLWKATFLITVKSTWTQCAGFFPHLPQFKATVTFFRINLGCVNEYHGLWVCMGGRHLRAAVRSTCNYIQKIQNSRRLRLTYSRFTPI